MWNEDVQFIINMCEHLDSLFLLRKIYETGTNVTRTTKKTPLTTFMKGEEWRLFLSFLFKSDKFS
jgi:hypothetical protein